jgi:leucyl-tRNA synthetase
VIEAYTVDNTKCYPIAFNGKTRFTLDLPADLDKDGIEKAVRENERFSKQMEGKTVVKVIIVPGKMVNFVIK